MQSHSSDRISLFPRHKPSYRGERFTIFIRGVDRSSSY